MRRSVISLGERTLKGTYGIVLAAGDLKVKDSKVKYLAGAGNVDAVKSTFDRIKIAGQLNAEESRMKYMSVAGDVNLLGICKGDVITVTGAISASYLDCTVLCNGTDNRGSKANRTRNHGWSGVFYAQTFENSSSMNMNFEYHFKNIINSSDLYSTKELECERFYSLANLQVEAVNADYIFLLAGEKVEVKQLTGERVTIKRSFRPDQQFKDLPKELSYQSRRAEGSITTVDVIEADQIDIEYTKSVLVCGEDVRIGDLCIVDHVEYRNSIEISKKAVVNEVVKL
jgi:hypothetical protein